MLADNVSYFDEDFLIVDITEETEATDSELAKAFGSPVSIDRKGHMKRIRQPRNKTHVHQHQMTKLQYWHICLSFQAH